MNNVHEEIYQEVLNNRPGLLKSISDDDLCSGCKRCHYKPGEDSLCLIAISPNWPAKFDEDGYAKSCLAYDTEPKLTTPFAKNFQGWELDVIDLLTDAFDGSRGDAQGFVEMRQKEVIALFEKGLSPGDAYEKLMNED